MIEQRLQAALEAAAQETSGIEHTDFSIIKRARRRIALTAGVVSLAVVALILGGTYAFGAFTSGSSEIGPARGSDASFARLFSRFSDQELAIVEIDADEGTICADLSSLGGYSSLDRIEITSDVTDAEYVVSLRPSAHSFTVGGMMDCISNVDGDLARAIVERPEDHFLLVDGPNDELRVSALNRGNGDGNYAIGPHITIAEGTFLGVDWEYYGYDSNDGLCLELAIDNNSGGGCGFRGRKTSEVVNINGTSFGADPDGPAIAAVEGEVADAVDRLEIEIGNEPAESIDIFQPPEALGLEDRVFAHLFDGNRLSGAPDVWLVAYGSDDKVLARERVTGLEDFVSKNRSDCGPPVDFAPTYLPPGWVAELQPGSGGGAAWEVVGHYGNNAEAGTTEKADGGFTELFAGESPYPLQGGERIRVLDEPARFGPIHEGFSVEFTQHGCDYALNGYVEGDELKRFAEGLRLPGTYVEPSPQIGDQP